MQIEPARCRQLNERRQAIAVSTLADEAVSIGSGAMAYTSGVRWICKAVGVDLDASLTPDQAGAICDWFRTRGVDPVIELSSLSTAGTLRVVADAGFRLVDVENVMATVPRRLERAPPPGFTVERLDPEDARAVRRHAEIVSSGFVAEGEQPPEGMIESGERSQRQPTSYGFFARREDGEPVAAAGTEILEIPVPGADAPTRLLALCGTTVLPANRRRGIQAALMAARLAEGVRQGASLGVVECKPGIPTERNAARLGFVPSYVRLVFRAPRA